MGFIELLVLAIGLSMDAFAVSVCKGLAAKKVSVREMATVGVWFGGFQALMPLIGYLLGSTFKDYITAIDHWVALFLLALIGGNMIKESFSKEEETTDGSFGFKNILLLAIATSIDALAVGITFALMDVNIWQAISCIGLTTFLCSAAGIKIGQVFGARFESKAEFAGGVILILIGLKIWLEHMGFWPF